MIDILVRFDPAGSFPYFKWKDRNNYLCRLKTVHLTKNSRGVWSAEALYAPLFVLEKHPRSWIVLVPWPGKLLAVSGDGKWPFLYFYTIKETDE